MGMGVSHKGWRISGEAKDGNVGRKRELHEQKAGGGEAEGMLKVGGDLFQVSPG